MPNKITLIHRNLFIFTFCTSDISVDTYDSSRFLIFVVFVQSVSRRTLSTDCFPYFALSVGPVTCRVYFKNCCIPIHSGATASSVYLRDKVIPGQAIKGTRELQWFVSFTTGDCQWSQFSHYIFDLLALRSHALSMLTTLCIISLNYDSPDLLFIEILTDLTPEGKNDIIFLSEQNASLL